MTDSGPLQTTPGQFDYPPASATVQMDASDGHGRRPTSSRPHQMSHPAPLHLDSNARDSGGTSPWIPSSPETRGRMQRVLRRVQEMQDNEDRDHTRRDIDRRLHEHSHRLRTNVQRLRDNGRRMSEVEGQMRDLDGARLQHASTADISLPPISTLSTRPPLAPPSRASLENVTPVRAALLEAGERLRLVNDELQNLLDRPMGALTDPYQRMPSVDDDIRRMMERTDVVFGDFGPASNNHDALLSLSENPGPGPLQDSLRRLRQFEADYEPLPDLQLANTQGTANASQRARGYSSDRRRSRFGHLNAAMAHPPTSLSSREAADVSTVGYSSSLRGSGPRAITDDDETGYSRRKRRRLDHDHAHSRLPLIQYGYEGQVVPGRLKLELLSSDGGIIEPPMADFMNATYGAENVLKDDSSVYCTKSQRCNMILQHQRQTTFCLERLVIKAPRTGFTDPVQEGLVFVSMRNDEIFDRTARYQIYSFPVSRFASHFASTADPDQGASLEIEHPVLEPSRPHGLANNSHDNHQGSFSVEFDDNDEDGDNDGTNHHTEVPEQYVSGNTARGGDSEEDSDEQSSDNPSPNYSGYALSRISRLRTRQWRTGRAAQRTRSEEIQAQRVFDNVLARGAAAQQRRQRRQQDLSSSLDPPGVPNPVLPLDFLTPAARFSMHSKTESDNLAYPFDNRSQCDSDAMTITFDPPVSGKFILLKMWSTRHGGNIDVQNVAAYGFAGPRWFPSIESR